MPRAIVAGAVEYACIEDDCCDTATGELHKVAIEIVALRDFARVKAKAQQC